MATNSNERLVRVMQATPEQLKAIDAVLAGKMAPVKPERRWPLLMQVREAAALLGCHRATIWRLMRAGRLAPVDLLGGVRVRREQVERIAFGEKVESRKQKTEMGAVV